MSLERAVSDLNRQKQEVLRLQVQLTAAQAKLTKLEHYIEMARAYETDQEEQGRGRPNGSHLVAAAIEIIKERGTRQPTRLLVEELEKRGHQIGGQNKVTNLSGSLSRSTDLISSRTEGWGLKEWGDGPSPQQKLSNPGEKTPLWKAVNLIEPEPESSAVSHDMDDEIPF